MITSVTTISISINVKPASVLCAWARPAELFFLPVTVFRAVQGTPLGSGIYVPNVLSAPCLGGGQIARRSLAPVGRLRHRIDWNAPKKAQPSAGGVVLHGHALHELIE